MKILMSLLSLMIIHQISAQTEPSRSAALAVLKKYNYHVYVSKKTNTPVGQLKFERHENMYTGGEGLYRYKTRAAKHNIWPNDRLVYTFKMVSPKDKDGVQMKYHFEVVYARSRCLTDGYGCMLLNEWELSAANKYGPFYVGAKNVDEAQVIQLIKNRFKDEKETVLKELENAYVADWIRMDSMRPASELFPENSAFKEKVISKVKRKNIFFVNVDRAVWNTNDPKIRAVLYQRVRFDVTYELVNDEWKITEMLTRGGHKTISDSYDVPHMYLTYQEGSFEEVYGQRKQVDFPPESCTMYFRMASTYYQLIKKSNLQDEVLKALYKNEADYQKDVRFFNYLEENDFSITIDSFKFDCSSVHKVPLITLKIKVEHQKFKGKLMKDWKSKGVSLKSTQATALQLYRYHHHTINISLKLELVKAKWKISEPIANEFLPDI